METSLRHKQDREKVTKGPRRLFDNLESLQQGIDDLQDKQRKLAAVADKTADDTEHVHGQQVNLQEARKRHAVAENSMKCLVARLDAPERDLEDRSPVH
mmetsp:Transcript_9149/g.17257  ORF Transcript_9149/g.17257 Transcript_9149/m.17257 type:complete len:99 (-) Transcript_9149:85-381(-)